MVRTRATEKESSAVPTTTRRKRRASSIASTTGENALTNKPRKRRGRRTDAEQVDEELDEATEAEGPSIETVETKTEYTSRQVHISETPQADGFLASSPPNPNDHAGTGRSLSPAVVVHPTKSRTLVRQSLPPRLPGTPDRLIDQVQFAPLRQTLSARNKRRLRRSHLSEEMNEINEHDKEDVRRDQELKRLHKEIEEKNEALKSMTWEIEDMRQRGIAVTGDDEDEKTAQITALQDEIAIMNEELTARNDGVVYHGGEDTEAEDDLIFIDPNDLNISQEQMTPINSSFERVKARPLASSPSPSLDPAREVEVSKFERAIYNLNKDAAEVKAVLQTMTIELQTLGFTNPEEPGLVVISAIRQAFQQAHLDAEELIPDQSPTNYEGGEFLKLLIANIRTLMAQADQDLELIRKHEEMVALLRGQHNGLLDQLATSDARVTDLEKHYKTLDRELDNKNKRIVEIEESYSTLEITSHIQGADIQEKNDRISQLESKTAEQDTAISGLKNALEQYRIDLANMESLVERMEQEHAAKVEKLESDATEAINNLKDELTQEYTNREIAEADIHDKTSEITRLQVTIEDIGNQLDSLKQQLADSEAQVESETALREDAEAEVAQKNEFIEDLEDKIDRLETNLENFRAEAAKLGELLEAERHQRQEAETELDARDAKIAELESRVHDEGVRGNELRMKLFQEQQDREKAVATLEATAADREAQYQDDMEDEISRREESERMVVARDTKIAELEEKILALDNAMVDLIKAKDDLQEEGEAENQRLEDSLATLNQQYDEMMDNKDAEIQRLNNDITELTKTFAQRTELIKELETENKEISEARQAENEEKDGQIADLEDDLLMARQKIEDLEKENSSLEHRVEHEASHLLQFQSEAGDKIDKLQGQLHDKKHEIKTLQQEAAHNHATYENNLENKAAEISNFTVVNTSAIAQIAKLKDQVAELKQKLRLRVGAEGNAIPSMLAKLRQAVAQAEEIGNDLVDTGEQVLEEVDGMEDVEMIEGQLVPVAASATVQVPNGFAVPNGVNKKVTKVTKKVRTTRSSQVVRDSGVGMTDEEVEAGAEEESMMLA